MKKKTIKDIDISGKRILVRVDFNVPLDKTGAITDDTRIRATLPTIHYLTDRGARVILISHLGRPKGKVVDELRLTMVAQRLSQILGQQVGMATDCIGPEVEKSVETLKAGDVLLLENLRFHPDEAADSPEFAEALSRLGDIFVNDAFGTSHRAHSSISGIVDYIPAVGGLLLEKEVETLSSILENPAHPFAALAGGAKVSDKIALLENTIDKVDSILVGGGMAATFLEAKSYQVGQSLVEKDMIDLSRRLMADIEKKGVRLLLPLDVVVADEVSAKARSSTVAVKEIPADMRIVDIGPRTIKSFSEELRRCKTIFWNGPMGISEIPQFAEGTHSLANLLASLDATTIVGGGSTAEVVTEMGLYDKMTFVSTGGGASLRFLGGQPLPGVEVLPDKE
ncbi:phosphoglycerate kinase [Chloroflexota bacterium]